MPQLDFLICSVPKFHLGAPLQGPSVLKSALQLAGFSCKILDLNHELGKRHSSLFPGKTWADLEPLFAVDSCYQSHRTALRPILHEWATRILDHEPRHLGFCVFTQRSFFIARDLSQELKRMGYAGPILWGGGYSAHCGELMKQTGVIDHYVIGEGENAIVRFAGGNRHFPGLDSKPATKPDLAQYPCPDYSDFEMTEYSGLYITASRSCPHRCSFCENPGVWGPYRTRDPLLVAREIQLHQAKTGIQQFYFTDNLLNGDMGFYRRLMTAMSQQAPSIQWDGFFVIRHRAEMLPSDFDLARRAGARTIRIGVESGSERVRRHMGKRFKEEDLRYFLEEFRRAGIKTDLMLIVGYPTEEERDFRLTLDLLHRYREFSSSGVIGHLRIVPLSILPQTPLWKSRARLGITYDGADLSNWRNALLDRPTRLKRYWEARELALALGYRIRRQQDDERNALFSLPTPVSFPIRENEK